MARAPKPKARKTLGKFGRQGRSVRCFLERGHELVRVQWRVAGQLRTESWPNTEADRERALAFAETLAEELRDSRERGGPAEPITIGKLWESFTEDHFRHLARNTQRIYTEGWRYFELFAGRHFLADDVTLPMISALRLELERRGLRVSVQRNSISTVKLVYKWGHRRELLTRNRVALYEFRMSKVQRARVKADAPSEYRREQFRALLAQFDPESATQWRAYVTLALCGYQGRRQHAVLHLQVEDIDLEAGVIRWREEWDKVGKGSTTPIRAGARLAIEAALRWREKMGYKGPWLLPAGSSKNKGETYTLRAFWVALREAERRAGIKNERGRGGHGFRRMLAGDVAELLGDPVAGLHAIGDSDIRQAERYIKRRDEKLEDAFKRLDEMEAAELEKESAVQSNPETATKP